MRHDDGLQPQAEAVADAHGEGDDEGAAQQQRPEGQRADGGGMAGGARDRPAAAEPEAAQTCMFMISV